MYDKRIHTSKYIMDNKEYLSSELPSELVNTPSGQVRSYNGQQVRVIDTGRGTRRLESVALDPNQTIQNAINLQREAAQPAIQSYKASIPETQAKYAQTRTQLGAERQPLEDRYNTLIASIKGKGEQQVQKQTAITSNELGKRGILGSSTLAQQEIQNATAPLVSEYANLEKDTTLSKEGAIRDLVNQIANLTTQETGDLRSINNAIAGLESGAASTGIGQGYQLYNQQLAQQSAREQAQREAVQQEIANELARASLANDTRMTDYTISKGGAGAGGLDLSAIFQMLGLNTGSTNTAQAPKSFQPDPKPRTSSGGYSYNPYDYNL